MQITVSDALATAARLTELSDSEAQRAWIIGLFVEHRLSLHRAAKLAGLDRESFKRHLASSGIALTSDEEISVSRRSSETDKPWLALRGSGRLVGDPFTPVVSEDEIVVLQRAENGVDC